MKISTTSKIMDQASVSTYTAPSPTKVLRSLEGTRAKNILLIITNNKWSEASRFARSIRDRGHNIIGLLHENGLVESQHQYGLQPSGKIQDLPKILETHKVDSICFTLSSLRQEKIKKAIRIADYYGVRVNLVPENPDYLVSNFRSSTVGGLPVVPLRQIPLDNRFNSTVKMVFDFLFALMVITVLSPLFIIVGILIYLDGKGPIIYAPVRKGEDRGTFRCYKFRTMSVCDNPVNGTKSTEKNDPRITKIGKYLRKFDLDELPQFFNVLKGEMSIVGPRPHRSFLAQDFRKIVNDYMVRHYVKPGITGWAQVNGWRGPTETVVQKQQRIKHDLWYIENWSFLLDLKIIFLTVWSKRTRKNAF